MYLYGGDADKPYGFGTYGGLDDIIWCCGFEDPATPAWTEQETLPVAPCPDSE